MGITETQKQPENTGKKIFLLYPHSVIKSEMLDLLIMAGFETYTVHDEKTAVKLLIKFPGSIMFINIDEGMDEKDWEVYIRALQESPKTKDCRLGIMSYNKDTDLMKKYLMDLSIPCGYVQLKLGLKESTKIIINTLEAIDARGRRSSIRVDCSDDMHTTLNFKGDTGLCQGKILDMSSTGIAARIDKMPHYSLNSILHSVQLKLYSGIVMTDMIYMGRRENDNSIHIMLFDPKMPLDSKLVVHHYIKQCLQKYISELKL